MKWEGPLFLAATLTLTLGSGTLFKERKQPPATPASVQENSGAGGAGMTGIPGTPGAGMPPGGTPLTGAGGTTGMGTNRGWRGYVDTDVEAIRAQLPPNAKHLAESFVSAGQTYGVDPLFLMSISKLETGNWTSNAFLNKNNAMGISNASGPTFQASHHNSIMTMAGSLAGAPGTSGYYNNATTVGQVGAIYAPSGAVNDFNGTNSEWGVNVGNNFDNLANTIRGG
jgi:hypothetical protein